jgi:dipeptide transport system substrate-binding protein
MKRSNIKLSHQSFVFLLIVFCSAVVNAQGKSFTFCAEASPISFNSQIANDAATFNAASRTMYNRLVGFENGSTRVAPSLAREWTVSPSGKEFTFRLREGVRFHTTDYFKPTRPLNADDVIFSFERMRDPKHPFHKVSGGQYPFFKSQQMGDTVDKIEKIDERTIKIKLHRPEAPFLANLAMDFMSILSAEYGQKLIKEKRPLEDMDQKPVGTGPFVFVSYEKNKRISYRSHPDYFEGRSAADRLDFIIVTDPEERLRKLAANECQLMPDPSPAGIAKIKANADLKLMQQPGLNIAYLAMSVQRQPFANISVRKAIHHALNRESYIKEVFGGNAQVAKNPIPPTMWSYSRRTQDYEYSVAKSLAHLQKAGLPNGFETELWYADVSRPYNPNSKRMAELIQKDLAAVGIRVKIRVFEWQDFLARSRNGEPPMSLQGWTGDNGDPDNFLNNLLSCQSIASGNNRARWCDKEFSFRIDRARVTTDIRQRTKFYEDAQRIFKEQVPWVTIAHSIAFKAARKGAEGFKVSPFGVIEFHKAKVVD